MLYSSMNQMSSSLGRHPGGSMHFTGVQLLMRVTAALPWVCLHDLPGSHDMHKPRSWAHAQARYEAAYVHVMNVLKYLLDPASGTAGTPLPAESHLSAAERQAFLQTLLKARALVIP